MSQELFRFYQIHNVCYFLWMVYVEVVVSFVIFAMFATRKFTQIHIILRYYRLKKILNTTLKVVFPFLLGGAILYRTYRDFDLSKVGDILLHRMDWWWMAVSLFFGVLSHMLRGWRWKQTLEPMGEHVKTSNCVNAIFISYASNMIIPRLGEVSRCGVLTKYDRVSFTKSLGTVVTERLIDSLCVLLIIGATLLINVNVFDAFFAKTGSNFHSLADWLASPVPYIIGASGLAFLVLVYFLIRHLSFFVSFQNAMRNVWEGILSLRRVSNLALFVFYTIAIWACYFFHFYLTFYCFDFSAHLGWMAGLVMFVGGSIAVLVPTPNGAGPWHFAVISMMSLYGVSWEDAGIFALIVHGIQTLLIILLGIYGLAALPFTNRR